jgi:hypothetical protein
MLPIVAMKKHEFSRGPILEYLNNNQTFTGVYSRNQDLLHPSQGIVGLIKINAFLCISTYIFYFSWSIEDSEEMTI